MQNCKYIGGGGGGWGGKHQIGAHNSYHYKYYNGYPNGTMHSHYRH